MIIAIDMTILARYHFDDDDDDDDDDLITVITLDITISLSSFSI
jgi:hypothetical protein